MEKVDFSNDKTFGTMLVDSKWRDKHKEIKDTYQLYLLAKNNKDSKM